MQVYAIAIVFVLSALACTGAEGPEAEGGTSAGAGSDGQVVEVMPDAGVGDLPSTPEGAGPEGLAPAAPTSVRWTAASGSARSERFQVRLSLAGPTGGQRTTPTPIEHEGGPR